MMDERGDGAEAAKSESVVKNLTVIALFVC